MKRNSSFNRILMLQSHGRKHDQEKLAYKWLNLFDSQLTEATQYISKWV